MSRTTKIILALTGVALAVCICGGAVVYNLPNMAARVMGLRAEGDTQEFIQELEPQQPLNLPQSGSGAGTPLANSALGQGEVIPEITLSVGDQATTVQSEDLHTNTIAQTTSDDGRAVVYVEYDEAGLNTLLADQVEMPPELVDSVSDISVDLKPGVMVLSANVNTGIGIQPVGAVLAFNESGTGFELAGIDIGGFLFSTPPEGEIADMAQQLEIEGNRLLTEIRLTGPDGQPLPLQQMVITEEMLQIVAGG